MSFQILSSELTGTIQGLDPFLSDHFINRAWRDIRDERQWSFLIQEGILICPTQITAGTVSFTQYGTTLTADATASAALLAVNTVPGLTNMQIRFGGSTGLGSVGSLYQITDVDDTDPTAIILTVDPLIIEATDADATYQCYRALVKPPVDDFLTWISVVDLANGLPLTNENQRLSRTSWYFDMRDPQRQAQGLAYFMGAFAGNTALSTRPIYEFWPHPTSGQNWYVRYRRQGTDFTSAIDTQPPIIPDQLILLRAYGWYAYPWAAANVGHHPNLRGVGWVSMTLDAKKMYLEEITRAKKQDDSQQLQNIWNRGHGLRHNQGGFKGMWDYPIDAQFLQSHLVPF